MYSVQEFIHAVEKRDGLICYGVGKRFHTFLECFEGSPVLDKISCCIDQIYEGYIEICEKKVEVYRKEKLVELKNKKYVLLITNLRYEEIYDELEETGILEQIECYCFTHLYGMILEDGAMTKSVPENLHVTEKIEIPKIIHYCWFGNNPIPDRYKEWMKSWKNYCPDYEIIEWNESNYDITKNKYMYEAYQSKKWGFVPDYARLDIIYTHGGIYLDTDVELVKNLDDLLYQKGFAGFERRENVALGLGFGGVKGLPILKRMMEDYENRAFILADGTLDLTPSPVIQTNTLIKKGLVLNGEYQVIDDMVIYPEKMFSGKSSYTRRVRLAPYTRSIHHYDASWADDEWRSRNIRFEKEMNE